MKHVNKLVGIITAAALLTTLAPMSASATPTNAPAKVEKAAPHVADHILVKFKAGKDIKGLAKKLGAGNVEDLGTTVQTKLVKVPHGKAAEFVEKFQRNADVEYAELDLVHTIQSIPNDPDFNKQLYLTRIQAPAAWDLVTNPVGPSVAVLSTGVDLDHPDLINKIVPGYDFANNDAVADDDQGHGTHLAGIVGASTNNSIGIASVAPAAKIMPVKVLSSSGSGTTSNIIKGVDFAKNNGAKVILFGVSGGGYTQALQDSINSAFAAGAVLVAATGSTGSSAITYPAGYNNVISVVATNGSDVRASFATYGTWADVAAPGTDIYSTAMGGGYAYYSGTSQAAAVAAGVVALLKTKNSSATSTALQNRLFSTANAITGTGTYWQYGRVNAYNGVNGF